MANKEKDDYLTSIAKTYFGTYAVFGVLFLLLALGMMANAIYKAITPTFFVYSSFIIYWILLAIFTAKVKNRAIKTVLILVWFFSPLVFKQLI